LVLEFDREKISKLISELNNSLNELKEIAVFKKNDFLSNKYMIASAKYFLITVIEAAVDICNHIISSNKFRIPDDYKDTFRIMAEERILEPKFSEKLMEMAKFRNRLVHIYWEVDDEVIYQILKKDLQDIGKFRDKIIEALNLK